MADDRAVLFNRVRDYKIDDSDFKGILYHVDNEV
jgi:hypothetical protein